MMHFAGALISGSASVFEARSGDDRVASGSTRRSDQLSLDVVRAFDSVHHVKKTRAGSGGAGCGANSSYFNYQPK